MGESLTIVSTVFWTLHITYTDLATLYVDSISMMCVQLGVVTLLSCLAALLLEVRSRPVLIRMRISYPPTSSAVISVPLFSFCPLSPLNYFCPSYHPLHGPTRPNLSNICSFPRLVAASGILELHSYPPPRPNPLPSPHATPPILCISYVSSQPQQWFWDHIFVFLPWLIFLAISEGKQLRTCSS